jgi:PAS domain S-box-containing protein
MPNNLQTNEELLQKIEELKTENEKLRSEFQQCRDERKQEVDNLNKSKDEMDIFFNSSLDLLCIANVRGEFVRLNPEWEKTLGYIISDLEGRQFLDFVHPDDIESTKAAMAQLEDQNEVLSFVNRYRHRDGSYRWIEWRSKSDGDMIYAAARDITERVIAEEKLKENQELYQKMNENSPIGMLFYKLENDELIFMGHNPAANELLKVDNSEFVGKTIEEAFPALINTGIIETYHEVAKKGTTWSTEQVQYDDGKITGSFEVKAFQTTHSNMVVLFSDITYRKQAEERNQLLVSILKQSKDFIGIASPNEEAFYVNPAGQEMVGLDGEDEVKQTKIEDYFFPEDQQFVKQAIFPTLMKEGRWAGEFRFRHFKTGEQIDINYDLFLTEDPQTGETINISTISRDITKQKRDEKALKENQEHLQSIFRAAPIGIGLVQDRILVDVNPGICAMLEYSKDELIGKSARILYPSQEEYEFVGREKYRQIAEKGTGTVETQWVTKSGKIIDILLSSTPLDLTDNSKGVTFTALDITDRKIYEKEIEENERRATKQRNAIAELAFDESMTKYDLSYSLDKISKTLTEVLNVKRASVWLLSEDGNELKCSSKFDNTTKSFKREGSLRAEDLPHYFAALRKENILSINDVTNDWRTQDFTGNYFTQHGIVAILDVGIQQEGQLIGVVCAEHSGDKRIWQTDEIFFVSTITNLVAQLIAINDRKNAEEQLRESTRRYRELFESSRDGFVVVDYQSKIIDANDAFCEMLGYTLEELKSMDDFYTITPERWRVWEQEEIWENRLMQYGESGIYEKEYIRGDGIVFPVELQSFTVKNNNGDILYLWGIARDITERKQAEIALEKRIIALTQPLDDPENILLEDLFDIEDLQVLQESFSSATGVASVITKPDGTPITKPSNFTHLCKDIIRRTSKGCENCYRSDAVIGKMNPDGPIIMPCLSGGLWDAGAAISVGGKHIANWLIGQVRDETQTVENIREYAIEIGADPDAADEAFHQVPPMSFDTFNYIAQLLFKITTKLSFLAYQNVQQARFISERKQAEETLIQKNQELEIQYEEYYQLNEVLRQTNYDLEKAKEKAEESDKLKSAFLQNMSHEIRTPLNGILGFTNLLQDEDITKDEFNEYTTLIKQSGQRLQEIVNNVLDISKIETGQEEIHIRQFHLNHLIKELFSFFMPMMNAKNIKLNYHVQLDDEYSLIETDEPKLIRVLTNLISNGLKFTPSGSIDYGYEIKDDFLEFYVKDTGIGIPLEKQDKIFERFIQADLSSTRTYEGAGLGLSICKGLVELLDGRIWFRSVPDKGTTFFFTIPYKPTNSYNEDIVELAEISTSKILPKILVVEDDHISFMLLKKILKNTDIELFHAENGAVAIEIVDDMNIDMILMDIRMPVLDGMDATKIIKAKKPDLPIIAQTAYAFNEEKNQILASGFDDYLSKPIESEKLMRIISKYL